MNLLLDTCTFLWVIADPSQLSARAATLAADPANRLYVSIVSAWEVAVKHALGRLVLVQPPAQLIPRERARHRLTPLPLRERDALYISNLPPLHRDPFDRMLVYQTAVRNLVILTPDSLVRQYPVQTDW